MNLAPYRDLLDQLELALLAPEEEWERTKEVWLTVSQDLAAELGGMACYLAPARTVLPELRAFRDKSLQRAYPLYHEALLAYRDKDLADLRRVHEYARLAERLSTRLHERAESIYVKD